jgi:hypothetical protein
MRLARVTLVQSRPSMEGFLPRAADAYLPGMGNTIEQTSAIEAWRLIHEVGMPVKKAAAQLGLPISDVYELLARERSRRDIASHRAAALGITKAPE